MARRRIFIGDLHGCREEFETLLETLGYDPSEDALHPVGDLVNRGPDSVGCVRLARELGAEPVLGNHDVHLLRQARDPELRGGRATLGAFRTAQDGEALLGWLADQPIVRDWPDVICVHAGLHPDWANPAEILAHKDPYDRRDDEVEFAVRARYCDGSGRTPAKDWPPPPAPFRPWDDFWRRKAGETRTVVFGHWARRGLVVEPRTRGLDSGCLYGGELSAWIAEEDRIVRVPARRVWYETV